MQPSSARLAATISAMGARRASRFSTGQRMVPISTIMALGDPGLDEAPALLEVRDLPVVLQRLADRVEALEQLLLAKGIDLEAADGAGRGGHGLGIEVDGEDVIAALGLLHQRLDLGLGQRDQQQAVVDGVVE